MKQRIRAIAWDVDGTLVDSEPLHHRALIEASAALGINLSDLPDQAFTGIHMHDVWNILSSRMPESVGKEQWLAAIDEIYHANRHQLVALPGAVQTVRILAETGLPQVCVSNSSRQVVDANLDALGIRQLIAHSISLNDVTEGKPDPMPYRHACQYLDMQPDLVLAIEDSDTGIASALSAGMPVAQYSRSLSGPLKGTYLIDNLDAVVSLALGQSSRQPSGVKSD